MRAGVPSRTALGVARRRAAHQLLDRPLVFDDPLAERILDGAEASGSNPHASRTLGAFVAARSRYAEDQLGRFFARAVRQYVILGAGLDTFAYRNPFAPALNVFEVDHPDTQVWKRERLRAARIAIPDSLRFVPVNFEKQDLGQALADALGFDAKRPAFFSLLGVTPYLTRDSVVTTLRVIAAMPEASGVVFDYAVPAASLSVRDRIGLRMLSARVLQIGEAFRLFLKPAELRETMRKMGFSSIQDLGQEEINELYFKQRTDGLRIGSALGRLLSASAGGGPGLLEVPVTEVEQFDHVKHALARPVKTGSGS